MTTYYVDSIAAANQLNLQPGDIVAFAAGATYTGTLNLTGSGTASEPITITSYGAGEKPVIDAAGADYGINTTGSYYMIDGLHVENAFQGGVEIADGSEHNTIQNMEISGSGYGVALMGENNLVTQNYIHDGTMIVNTPGGDDDYGANGVVIFASNNEVSFNDFTNLQAQSDDYGEDGGSVEVYAGNWLDANITNLSIHDNISTNNNGFMEVGGDSGTSLSNVTITNNVSQNDGEFQDIHNGGDGFAIDVSNYVVQNNTSSNVIWTSAPYSSSQILFQNNANGATLSQSQVGGTSINPSAAGTGSTGTGTGSTGTGTGSTGTGTGSTGTDSGSTGTPTVAITSTGGTVTSRSQTVAGTVDLADAGSTVNIYDGTTQIGTATADSNGGWTADVRLTNRGANVVTATDANDAGTGTSNAVTYTVARGSTGTGTGSTGTATLPTVAITSTGGTVTSRSQTVAGTVDLADAGSTVNIYDGTTQIGTATAAANGGWTANVRLTNRGANVVTATDANAAGTGTSNSVTYTVAGRRTSNASATSTITGVSSATSAPNTIVGTDPSATANDPANTLAAILSAPTTAGTGSSPTSSQSDTGLFGSLAAASGVGGGHFAFNS